MTKLLMFISALVLTCSTVQARSGDSKGSKLTLTFADRDDAGAPRTDDCKISRKELKNWTENAAEKKHICAQIRAIGGHLSGGQEATPESLGTLVDLAAHGRGQLTVTYGGTETSSLLETFAEWQKHLVQNVKIAAAADWNLALVSQSGAVATLRYTNSKTRATYDLTITMGVAD